MNVPKLRFKEFNDEWQSINLADIFQYFGTNSFSREQLSESGILKNLHYGDIHKKYNSIVNENDEITSYVKDINYVNKYELLKNNDLIFADASEDYEGIGKAVEVVNVNNNTISGLHTILARDNLNVFAPMFKGYYFNSPIVHNQIRVLANGFKVYGISKDSINKLNIKVPSINEQSKIANTLYLLDKKIELQSKKIEDLKLFKSSQISSVIDSLKCDEIELREIGNFISGNAIGKEKIKESGVPIILYGDLYTKYWEVIDKVEQYTEDNEKYIKSKKNDLLFPTSTTVDSISLISPSSINIDDVIYGGDLIVFRADYTRINSDFLSYQINHYKRKEFSKKAQGSTIIHIHAEDLLSSKVKLPNIEIQNLISKTFNILNKKIIKEEEKLNKLNNLKKGLMQSMFV